MTETAAAPSARRDAARRWTVTAAAVIVFWAMGWTPLPFVRIEWLHDALLDRLLIRGPSLLELGLTPIVAGFLAVELVALAVPALRRYREGTRAERAGLTQAAWLVALALAAVQAVAFVRWLGEQTGPDGGGLLPRAGRLELAALALTLVGAVALVGVLARAVDRFGLGDGFAVLAGASLLGQLAAYVLYELRGVASAGQRIGVLWLALAAAAMALVIRALHAGGRTGVRVPVPTCGLVPLALTAWTLSLPYALGPGLSLPELRGAQELLERYGWPGHWALAVGFAVALALAFTSGAQVRAAWSAARLGEPPPPASVDVAIRAAHRWSLLLVAAVAAAPLAGGFVRASFSLDHLGLFQLAAVIAVVMDVAAEARARRRLGPLVPAFALHRVYAVEPALAALGEAGIPAAARARYFRALLHVLAPFAPIELLVPAARAEEAAAICARIARPEAAPPAAAEVAPS